MELVKRYLSHLLACCLSTGHGKGSGPTAPPPLACTQTHSSVADAFPFWDLFPQRAGLYSALLRLVHSFFRQGCGQGFPPCLVLLHSVSSSSPGHEGSVKPRGQLAPQLLLGLSEGVKSVCVADLNFWSVSLSLSLRLSVHTLDVCGSLMMQASPPRM